MSPSVFDPGLESITVAETELSYIDGENGTLVIGGYPVEELAANATYEETLFLLLEDRLPTTEELDAFRADLASRRAVGQEVRNLLRRAADEPLPVMDALRMGVAAANLDSETADSRDATRRVVAVVPTIVATYWRYLQGELPITPDEDLCHAANYLYMLTGEEPPAADVQGLETFLTTAIDHGLNASTFTARVVASTESDLVSAATAAVGALKGPRHGGILALVFDMLWEAHESGDVEAYVRDRVSSDEGLRGFDHRLYQVRDPRVAVLEAAAERFYADAADDDFFETVQTFEDVARDVVAQEQPDRQLQPTMDVHTATLLHGVGVPRDLITPTFAVSRVGGWMAHCLEQYEDNELIRPVARYVGAADRTWTPVEQRGNDSVLDQSVENAPLDSVSETLAALSEPSRLEILLVLSGRDEPVAYSTLQSATSIDDKGRFNYHLRQLRGFFVADGPEGYTLTDAGETLVETLVTDDQLLRLGGTD